jgi:hypothetical protein
MTSSAPDPRTRERLTGPAIRAFFRITELWALNDQQRLVLLGDSVARSTLQTWKEQAPRTLSVDQLERLSYIVAIYEGLMRMFRRAPEMARRWLEMRRPEHPFLGKTPLEFMLGGRSANLAVVREWVDHANGGPPSREEYARPPREA